MKFVEFWTKREITGRELVRRQEAHARAKADFDTAVKAGNKEDENSAWVRMQRICGNLQPVRA